MEKLRDPKLWKAVGLGVVLFALRQLTTVRSSVLRGDVSYWEGHIWPNLSPLLVALLIAAVALLGGRLLRPSRPQRLSAWIGAIGGLVCFVFWDQLGQVIPALFSRPPDTSELLNFVKYGFALALHYAPVLGVGCWLGADYWRASSWAAFRRGPAGAIVKGAIAGGAVAFVLSLPKTFYLLPHFLAEGEAPTSRLVHFPYSPWANLLPALSGIAGAAVTTGFLAYWRPSPRVGAFVGAGLAVGGWGYAFLTGGREMFAYMNMHASITQIYLVHMFLTSIITSAVAGSYAGRWKPEAIVADASE